MVSLSNGASTPAELWDAVADALASAIDVENVHGAAPHDAKRLFGERMADVLLPFLTEYMARAWTEGAEAEQHFWMGATWDRDYCRENRPVNPWRI